MLIVSLAWKKQKQNKHYWYIFVFAGVIVLLSLAFLMPAFYYIPKASLAAVVICAVTPMVDYRVVAKIWKIHSMFFGIRTQCTFTV